MCLLYTVINTQKQAKNTNKVKMVPLGRVERPSISYKETALPLSYRNMNKTDDRIRTAIGRLATWQSAIDMRLQNFLERTRNFEILHMGWKPNALPLSYARLLLWRDSPDLDRNLQEPQSWALPIELKSLTNKNWLGWEDLNFQQQRSKHWVLPLNYIPTSPTNNF